MTKKDTETETAGTGTASEKKRSNLPPRVIKLGSVKKSQVKKLKNGHGKLMEEILQIVNNEIAKLPAPPTGKVYQPVVIVHRCKKGKKRKVSVLGAKIDRKKLRKTGISL
ncbi:MAG TPA: hypothetical protein VMF06_04660 [Candidatus Limnocylindria bacterium]|nr:hypothetical protein [Candidatus Limnocylindria bacterium]